MVIRICPGTRRRGRSAPTAVQPDKLQATAMAVHHHRPLPRGTGAAEAAAVAVAVVGAVRADRSRERAHWPHGDWCLIAAVETVRFTYDVKVRAGRVPCAAGA